MVMNYMDMIFQKNRLYDFFKSLITKEQKLLEITQ